MSDSGMKPDLKKLVAHAYQDVAQQQAETAAAGNQHRARSNIRNVLCCTLLLGLAVAVFIQYPRINEPYVWPDAASSAVAAEADLEAVVGAIETFRLSRGQYPSTLGEVHFPGGLAQIMAGSELDYSPNDKGYALTWTLPDWVGRYSSTDGQIIVEPRARN